jgi:predicted nucleic acid-binding protein
MYLDSAYLAKIYLNEADSGRVRELLKGVNSVVSSIWAVCEVACVFHRQLREGWLTAQQYQELLLAFSEHVNSGVWTLAPITERILKRSVSLLSSSPSNVCIRAGDSIHLTTAQDLGERDIWTNDRHMLAAAPHFGLIGRSV